MTKKCIKGVATYGDRNVYLTKSIIELLKLSNDTIKLLESVDVPWSP
jgi:hypothetical protein